MEFRLFGPGGVPGDDFRRDIEVLVSLDDRQLEVIANWFLTTREFNSDAAISSPAIVTSSLTPDQVIRSVDTLQFILEAWRLYGLSLEEIQADLMVIGATAEQIERLGALLQRLESVRERAYTDFMRNEYENAVLPTLEDVSFVCDVRPIFEDEVDLSSEGNRAVRHTRILGVTHRVLAVLTTEDPGGKRRRFTFQMGDRTVDELQSALERVRGQLDILKAKISVTHDSK